MEEKNTQPEVVVDSEGKERHAVDAEGNVLARSDNDPIRKDQFDADNAPQVPEQTHLEPAPDRHEHTAYESEAVGATVDDADFDAEEKTE